MLGKFFALLAAIAGVVAFVLPFLTIKLETYDKELELSGIELVTAGSPSELLAKGSNREISTEAEERLKQDPKAYAQFESAFNDLKMYTYVMFAPLGLIVLVTVFSLLTGFGRMSGVLVLLGGIVAGGIYYLLNHATTEATEQMGEHVFELMLGFTVYASAAGAAGLVGLLGIISPQKKKGDDKKKKK